MENDATFQKILKTIVDVFTRKMAFMQPFNLQIEHYDAERAVVRFEMSEKLVGNMLQNILHGGASFSALDTIGGMLAIAATCAKEKGLTHDQLLTHIAKAATVNLRIDYLRPGRGKYFVASAEIVRCGNKVTVIRSELRNDQETLICTGIANYMVGS